MSDTEPALPFDDDVLHALAGRAFESIDGDIPAFAREAESFAFALSLGRPVTLINVLSDSALTDALTGVRDTNADRIIRWQAELVDIELTVLVDGNATGQIVVLIDNTPLARLTVESGFGDSHQMGDVAVDAFGLFHIGAASSPLRLRVELADGAEAHTFVTEWVWR